MIPTDFLRFNYEYREDRTNKGEHYGEVTVEIPFSIDNLIAGKNPLEGFGARFGGSRSMHDRLVEPVRRNVDVVVKGETGGGPVDELVMPVVFVSDTASPGSGDGTFETPLRLHRRGDGKLPAYQWERPHDPRDGSRGSRRLRGGGSVTLSDLFIWGSGFAYPSYSPISNFLYGMPYIDSTLSLSGSNISVRGLGFDVDGAAIDVLGGENIFLGDNDFGPSSIGVRLGGGSTTTIASTNSFGSGGSRMVGTGILVDGGMGSIGPNNFYVTGTGIEFRSGSGLSVLGSTFDLGGPGDTGIVASGGTGGSFGGNTFTGTGTGITFTAGSGTTVSGNVFGSELARLVGTGINIVAGTDTAHDAIDGNDLYVDGIGVLIAGDESDLAITNNTIDTNYYGVYGNAPDNLGAPGTPLTVTGNRITVDGTGGARDVAGIYLRSGGNIDATITGNDMTGGVKGDLAASGVDLEAAGDINGSVTDNDLSGGVIGTETSSGIVLSSTNGAIGTEADPVEVQGNELFVAATGAGSDAYGILLSGTTGVFADVTGNDLSAGIIGSRDAHGISLRTTKGDIGSASAPVSITGNTISAIGGGIADGISLDARDADLTGNNIFASIIGNNLSAGIVGNLRAFGVYMRADTGTIDATVTDNNLVVESTGPNSDAAGIFALGDVVSGTYSVGTGSIAVTAPRNAYGIIDAEIVDDLAELNTLITSDTSGWTYIRNGTYSGTINAVNRGLTLWGEGYDMYGMGSTGYPTFNRMLTLAAPYSEVMGLRFVNTTDNVGINITNGTGVTIRNNIISLSRSSTSYGIYATNPAGIGTAVSPLIIRNNTITVASNPDGYGISLSSVRTSGSGENRIFALIENNILNISGNNYMRGVHLNANYSGTGTTGSSYIGSADNPVVIRGNTIRAYSTYGNAYGIIEEARTGIFTDIINNDMASTGGISGYGSTYGIYLNNPTANVGSIGSEAAPVIISGNAITARGTDMYGGIGYGINIRSQNNLFADVTDNNMAGGVGITGLAASVGIGLTSVNGSVGSAAAPVIVDNNLLHVTTTGTNLTYAVSAYGVNISGKTGLFTEVTNNDMSSGIVAPRYAYGIYLTTTTGDIGSRTLPTLISGNRLNVTATTTALTYATGYGIYEQAQADLFGHVIDNTIIAKGYTAYAAYLRTATSTGTIGDFASSPQVPFLFTGNSGSVDGTNAARYMLYLYSRQHRRATTWTSAAGPPTYLPPTRTASSAVGAATTGRAPRYTRTSRARRGPPT